MRKRKHETTEYIPEWDAGSYQTGAAKPPKKNNGLVTCLLVAVICLGGLASAFGVLNFRLLAMMSENGDSVTPLDTNQETQTTVANAFLNNQDEPAPNIPDNRELKLAIDIPKDSSTADDTFSHNDQALVSVYSATYGGGTLSGTGIILSRDGYILTNAHILEAAQRVFVYLPDGQLKRAAIVGTDPFTDLAVLYIQAEGLTAAIFANAGQLPAESEVYAPKEQPDADYNFMLSGTVYGLKTLSTGDLTVDILQSSLWGNNGPVYDSMGHIVGIRAGKISNYFADDVCGARGIAIPTETMLDVVQALMEDGHVEGRPVIGIQVETISKLYQHYWELPGGLLVTQIEDSSNAFLQGLEEGDILLTLDGNQLTSRADLYATLYQTEIGDELIAAVFRDGRKFTVTLTVEEMEG